MTPAFTIILPHLRNSGNDAALKVCLDCLMTNTVNDFDLLMCATQSGNLYATVNRMVASISTEYFAYWSSDMFPAKAWDVPMLEIAAPDTIVTNVLVEPGVIGMHPDNVHKDFGRRPETFDRAGFEAWSAADAPVPDNYGWYAPYLMNTQAFLDAGGFELNLAPDHHGFTPADMLFFENWQAQGRKIQRAKSYTYHLQRWSQVDEQVHEKREVAV